MEVQDTSPMSTATMMEATFKIKWDDGLGRGWMNIDNLKACLFSKEHIGGKARDMVRVEPVIKEGE